MNRHLNLFRFYGESEDKEKLENNLTKGLALCLKYDPFFLHSFISEIDPLYSNLNIPPQDGSFFNIDIQVQSNRLEGEKVIAVSMTVDDHTAAEYEAVKGRTTESPIIDLVITYADTVVICEIKPSNDNCLAQLKNQVSRYKLDANETFKSFSWKKVTALLEKITNVSSSMGAPSQIASDYLDMLKGHFPKWHPTPRLNELTAQAENLQYNIEQRLIEVCNSFDEMELTDFRSRISFQLNWAMASELKIQTNGVSSAKSLDDILIEFRFWAGDTKKQGYSLFKSDYVQQLFAQKNIKVRGEVFNMICEPYFRVSSFQRGVVWFEDIKKEDYVLFNKELFSKLAGRKKRSEWPTVDTLISKFDSNWKEQSQWTKKIEGSNRTQVDISMGVGVKVSVPLSYLREVEMKDRGLENKLREIIQALNSEFGSR
jgi:hypothetical protein